MSVVAELFRVFVNLLARAAMMFCIADDVKSVFFLPQSQHGSRGAGLFDSHLDTDLSDVLILFTIS